MHPDLSMPQKLGKPRKPCVDPGHRHIVRGFTKSSSPPILFPQVVPKPSLLMPTFLITNMYDLLRKVLRRSSRHTRPPKPEKGGNPDCSHGTRSMLFARLNPVSTLYESASRNHELNCRIEVFGTISHRLSGQQLPDNIATSSVSGCWVRRHFDPQDHFPFLKTLFRTLDRPPLSARVFAGVVEPERARSRR
jgi:hypothetical protein